MAYTIGSVKIRIGADLDPLSKELQQAARLLKKSGKEFKTLGADLTRNLTLPLAGIGVVALKTFGQIDSLKRGLETIMGSASAAGKEFEKLRQVAKLPGIGLEEAVKGSVNLQAAGFSADEARKSLTAFGNALGTVGKGKAELDLVVLALSQLQNKTGGFGQDLRQLTEQLPQLRGALVDAFGVSTGEEIQKLGFTGKDVVQKLTAEFAKLPLATAGFKNSFENATDSMKIAAYNLGKVINEQLNVAGLLDKVGNKVSQLADDFGKADQKTKENAVSLGALTAAAGPAIYAYGFLTEKFAAFKLKNLELIKSLTTFGGRLTAITKIAAGGIIGYAVLDNLGALLSLVKELGTSLGALATKINVNLSGPLKAASFIVTVLVEDMRYLVGIFTDADKAWTKFKNNIASAAVRAFGDDKTATPTNKPTRGGAFIRPTAEPGATDAPKIIEPKGLSKVGQALADVKKELSDLTEKFNVGLIPAFELADAKADIFRSGIEKLITDGNLKATSKEVVALKESLKELQPAIEPLAQLPTLDLLKPIEGFSHLTTELEKARAAIKGIGEEAAKQTPAMREALAAQTAAVDTFNERVHALAVDGLVFLGEQLGGLFTGDANAQTFFSGLLGLLGDFMVDVGKQMITLGTVVEAIKSLFQFPGGAVIGGLALVAAGTLLKNLSKTKIPSLAIGTDLVKQDGLAQLHKGERVVPANVVRGGFSGGGAVRVIGSISGNTIALSNDNARRYSLNRLR